MSLHKRNFKRPKDEHIPLLKPVPLKYNNQQSIRQIYQSNHNNQKTNKNQQKKYYLPINNKKQLQNLYENHQKNKTKYRSYLQSQFYIQKEQELNRNIKTDRINIRNSETDRINIKYRSKQKNNVVFPSNISPSVLLTSKNHISKSNRNNNTYNTNQKNHSIRYLKQKQQPTHQLYQISATRKLNSDLNTNLTSRYRKSSVYNLPNHNESFKIRKSNKKSLSGSLNKKSHHELSRDDTMFEKTYTNHVNVKNIKNSNEEKNQNVENKTKSYLETPKNSNNSNNNSSNNINNDLLQKGKLLFKNGNLSQALELFTKGNQSEPINLNFSYNISMIYLKQHNYQQGLRHLQQIIRLQPYFKRTTYLFAAISCRHLSKLPEAIQYSNKGLSLYKNYTDLYYYRAKIYKQQQQLSRAIQDLQTVVGQEKSHIEALYMLGQLYYQKELYTHSISTLSTAIYSDQNKLSLYKSSALKLRAKIYLSQGKIKQARKDIIKLKSQNQKHINLNNNCEFYYLLGKLQIIENNISDALISFQKCLRNNEKSLQQPSNNIFGRLFKLQQLKILSLIQICKTKINIKDFYSAYHHISRAKYLKVNQKIQIYYNLNILYKVSYSQ